MAQTTEYRLETLEAVLAEFIMQTNRSLSRMERDTEDFKEAMQRSLEEQQRKEELRLAESKTYREEQQRKEEQRLAELKAYQEEQQRKDEQRLAELRTYREEQQAYRDEERRKEEVRLTESKTGWEQQQRKDEQRMVELKAYQEEQQRKEEQRLADKRRADEEWKAEKKQMNREWNQKWGEMAEKLGTFAEDLAAPNLRRISREQFGYPAIDYYAVRIDKRNPLDSSQLFEFDGMLVTGQTLFFLEAKFTVRMTYLEGLPRLIENFKLCFPEYATYKLIPVFASMSIQPDQVRYLTKQDIYAMALGEETMELLNFDELHPR
ncbi:MAG: hypothetical protein H7Z72_04360 [Bacteroidetes bacterium]|nr:hypothetical protein [Fibrella sp.]